MRVLKCSRPDQKGIKKKIFGRLIKFCEVGLAKYFSIPHICPLTSRYFTNITANVAFERTDMLVLQQMVR